MFAEILLASVIVLAALYMLYKNIKKSASGKCGGCPEKSEGCSCCDVDSRK